MYSDCDDHVVGNEDCLYLNIYTHTTNVSANLDVLVHIHGGAFMFGGGAGYGPYIIMDRNIVYVNFNYRLGPLGNESAYKPANAKPVLKITNFIISHIGNFTIREM